jgi:hypothetical protein
MKSLSPFSEINKKKPGKGREKWSPFICTFINSLSSIEVGIP